MSEIICVRHGQASFGQANYDNLSELGKTQCSLLGSYFKNTGYLPDVIYSGNLNRHRQTTYEICNQIGFGIPCHEMISLNEHLGPSVVAETWSHYVETKLPLKKWLYEVEQETVARKAQYMSLYETITLAWAKGEIKSSLQNWEVYVENVKNAYVEIQNNHEGQQVLIVTSGGPKSIMAGLSLNLSHQYMMPLTWEVFNSSFASFELNQEKLVLRTFNETPHLLDSKLKTLV